MINEADVSAYYQDLPGDDDRLFWEGPPPFVGNREAFDRALAESNSVPEFIQRGHEYNRTPEAVAVWQALTGRTFDGERGRP